ncbi:MAG: type 4a pilus biogenesis protein PilO [Elusimicrobiota bacterium]|jgi:Tfp pilus assembly protein PilO
MIQIDIGLWMGMVQDEIRLVSTTFREKGLKRFGRVLLVGAALIFASRFLVYSPASRKLSNLSQELAIAKTTADHSDRYKDIKNQLEFAYSQMPATQDRATWLSDAVKDALRAEGIVASQFMPPSEEEQNGVLSQSINVTVYAKFSEFMGFLHRLEKLKPLPVVTQIDLTKKSTPMGRNEISCTISTLILTERY